MADAWCAVSVAILPVLPAGKDPRNCGTATVQSGGVYPRYPSRRDAGVMTQLTQDTAPAQYAEGGGIRFAYRRLGVPGRPPLGVRLHPRRRLHRPDHRQEGRRHLHQRDLLEAVPAPSQNTRTYIRPSMDTAPPCRGRGLGWNSELDRPHGPPPKGIASAMTGIRTDFTPEEALSYAAANDAIRSGDVRKL